MRLRPLALVLATFAIFGCAKRETPKPAEVVDAGPKAHGPTPPSQRELPTTDGGIAITNLNASIRGAQEALSRRVASMRARPAPSAQGLAKSAPRDAASAPFLHVPAFDSVAESRALVELLLTRAHVSAVIADYDSIVTVAEDAVRMSPESAEARLVRASARNALHQFTAALEDIDAAEKLGAPTNRTRPLRAAALAGRGDLAAALVLREAAREAHPSTETLGAEAALLAELGKTEQAAARFHEAEQHYRNVAPFPVVWLFLEQSRMWARAGKPAVALAYTQAAYDRLPADAHVAAHLAALTTADRAVELLTPIVTTADDPSVLEVLARRLDDRGAKQEAKAMFARVGTRYEAVLSRYPEAFAEHAGFFWLDLGSDPKKALDLAKQNLAVRKSAKAYELGLLAASAAGEKDEACALGKEAQKLPHITGVLREIAARACP